MPVEPAGTGDDGLRAPAASSGPIVVELSTCALCVHDALSRLVADSEAGWWWSGPQRVLADETGYVMRSVSVALGELERAGLLLRQPRGRELVYHLRSVAPDGRSFVVTARDGQALPELDPAGHMVKPAGGAVEGPDLGTDHGNDLRNDHGRSQKKSPSGAPVSTVPTMSSSSSSSALLPSSEVASEVEGGSPGSDLRNGRGWEPAAIPVVLALQGLDLTPEPWLVERLVGQPPEVLGEVWRRCVEYRARTPRFVALTLDSVLLWWQTPPAREVEAGAGRTAPPRGTAERNRLGARVGRGIAAFWRGARGSTWHVR